jgi:PST family polysaccharide transporter
VQPALEGTPDETSRRPPRQWYGKVAKRGVAWSFVREFGTELIATPTGLVLARLLSPADFGVVASAAFFLTLASRLTNFGFNLALARIKNLRPEHSSSVFVLSIGVGVTAYAILASSGSLLASFFRAPQLAAIMPIAALGFLITPWATVPAALMTRQMRFRENTLVDWLSSLASATTVIVLALSGYGYWSLVYNQLVNDVVTTGGKLILCGWRPSFRFSATAMKELLSFGTGVFAKRLLDYSAGNLDNLIVGRTLGMSALGFYDKGFVTVRRVLTRLNTGGPMVSFRVLSLIHGEPERFRKAYHKVILATALITYPALLGLAALGPDLIPVMYGARWAPTILPFQILCISGILKVLTEYAGSAIQAMGKIWGQVARQVIQVVLIVVFVAIFSPWGLPGAAFGVLLATLGMHVLMQTLLMKLTSITPKMILESQLPGLLCGIAVSFTMWSARWVAIGYAPSFTQWQRLIIEASAGTLSYLVFMKFNRFPAVRRLVQDTAADLAPPLNRVVRLLA